MILAIIVSVIAPYPGAWLNQLGLLPWLVACIFFINGIQTSSDQLKLGKGYKTAFSLSFVINLMIAPLLGALCYTLLPLSHDLLVGLVVMSAVPPTLSSCIVLTRLTGGNAQWSMFFTLSLNFIGILTIPFSLSFILGQSVGIEGGPLFIQLIEIVLLPFLSGMLVRRLMGPRQLPPVVSVLPTLFVIAGAWLTLSSSQPDLIRLTGSSLLSISVLSLILHGLLLIFCWYGSDILQLHYANRLAVLFTASQKTMPIAVSVIVSINSQLGVAVVTCIVYHLIQMLFDSQLASRLNRNQAGFKKVKI